MSEQVVKVPETGTATSVVAANSTDLPATGVMATNPALTVGGVIAAFSLVVNFLLAQGYIQPPGPETVSFFDEYGKLLAALAVAGLLWVQGWITRNHVVAPATLARLVPSLVRIKR